MEQMTFEAMEVGKWDYIKNHLDGISGHILGTLPEDARVWAAQALYFAGGCIVSLAQGAQPVDYDIFITDEYVRDYVVQVLSGYSGVAVQIKAKTENAITLTLPTGQVVQIVTRFTGPPERVFSTFDYEHCKAYYVPHTRQLHGNWDLILDKKLVYTGEKDQFTLNTLKRMVKFVRRGYVPDNESLVNLHKAIHKQDLNDPEVHRAQTIGFYGSSFE